MSVFPSQNAFKIDPRTLFILNVLFCITMFIVSSEMANHLCFTIAFLLMVTVKMYKKAFAFAASYLAIVFLNYFFLMYPFGNAKLLFSLLFYLFSKFIPIVMIASILVNTIKTSEMITAIEKMKLPKGIMLAIIVAFRFVPTIQSEMAFSKESMHLRGIGISFKNILRYPVRTVEYSLIPLLFRSLKISEELTATALTRGVEHDVKRSAYFDVEFKKFDGAILTVALMASIFVFLVDRAVWVL
ncbi:energy-coupling factor transporter transmembrane component T [Fusibacter sp. 3D3]|uniref:energy-coupling factor transporter transmembrane component T n=1 Tax=Fusibacter sp. 3D3 TaxID=1048380 RepID=UPI000852A760|nr:energy-coupling factor transporter transmembrane component T [Fusibacter sp. 3D3]GAU75842.1 transmembrane component BL0694 of energizing module of predicted ECF transporter [Fusibacter sp. 3D3]